ncbi:glycosyltransferase [Psychroserpens luteolus]|uniref:glycosyltransferase n=1 Tax=Psychroserpens luteolus TaxID=2855840 RepID=UPI001E4BC401|nr:glycosyltransferase [Psychroserpens luteolus]MCD2257851.1 glycosyltransferase [Psychroserpens luteolus]
MLTIVLIITVLYLLFIGSFIYGFDKVVNFKMEDLSPKTKFSVIIPFRNEAEHLPQLIATISSLNYPKSMFEILFVDDESTDDSVEKIYAIEANLKSITFSVLANERLTKSPKKDAITKAIKHAKYDWIITTDADCQLPKYWLDCFDSYIQNNTSKVLVAPVTFDKARSFFERFQLLDILSLQGATIGGFGIKKPFLCNGANLAYKKGFFNSIEGFKGNSNIASGDDIFLLEKAIKKEKNSVHYIKNNHITVTTKPEKDFKALKAQRVRWAAKTSSYKNPFTKLTGLIILLMNALMVSMPLLAILQIITLKTLAYSFAIKFLIDFLLLFKTSRFFNQESYLGSYVFSSILYPFFNVYIAFISVFKGYKWKDRPYSK